MKKQREVKEKERRRGGGPEDGEPGKGLALSGERE